MKCDKYIGCDLHQATTVVAVLDSEGKVVMETIVATEAAAIILFLNSLSGPLHITLEETTRRDAIKDFADEHTAHCGDLFSGKHHCRLFPLLGVELWKRSLDRNLGWRLRACLL